MENRDLESLLSKYRMTFHWGVPGMKWWLIGQVKGGNSLKATEPQPAANYEEAQAAAAIYIRKMFES